MLLLFLHGRGESPESVESIARALLPDGERLMPRGPHRFGEGHAWALKNDEVKHLHDARALVRTELARARDAHGLRAQETLVAGFSQGAAVALDALLTLPPDECPSLVLSFGGYLPRALTYAPHPSLAGRRAHLAHGSKDTVVGLRRAEDAKARLESFGVLCELHRDDADHRISPEMIAVARRAIVRREREVRLAGIVDDVLVGRDLHGLSPRVARDLQLAAAAVNHDRFRRLLGELARLLEG